MNEQDYQPGGKFYAAKNDTTDETLAKVRALWQSSQDESYPEHVREAYRTKAEALMFLHRITLAEAQQDTNDPAEPVWRTFDICKATGPFVNQYTALAYTVMEHCDLRAVFYTVWKNGESVRQLEGVGYPADIAYFDMLFTTCLLAFGGKLEPKWDPSLRLEENVYRMRSAGMERGRIARAAWPEQYATLPATYVNKTLNKKVTTIFTEMARRHGDDPSVLLGRGNNVATFRESYAEAFVNELWHRFNRMRRARGQEQRAVVLADVKEKVNEAFYQKFPSRRPRPPQPGDTVEYHAPNADCERCRQAKSGFCRKHNYLKPSNAKIKERPYSRAGAERGTVAAQSVDLGATGTSTLSADSNYPALP